MAVQAQLYSENLGFPLGGSQDLTSNACGSNLLCLHLHQEQQLQLRKQQQHQHQMQFQQLQNLHQKNQNLNSTFDGSTLLVKNNTNHRPPMANSQYLDLQIERQRQEIDQFIHLQNERLRLALHEQRKQQLGLLFKAYESKAQVLLRQKDEEIAKAVNRTLELEEFLKRMETENQTWQRVAKENEAMVMSLNNTIEQLRENALMSAGALDLEDAESCCDVIEDNGHGDRAAEPENMAWAHDDRDEGIEDQRARKMVCSSCNSGKSCMIFLPCRHLSSCRTCEPFLDSCPVCKTVKKASIEALI